MGRCNSAREVVREALRLLEDHEVARTAQLDNFRKEIDQRLASLDHGKGIDGETAFAEYGKSQPLAARRLREHVHNFAFEDLMESLL